MTWKQILDEPLFRRLSIALLHFLWQGAAVATGYALVDAAARRRAASATFRYALGCGALAAMLALPVWTFSSAASVSAARELPLPVAGLSAPVSPAPARSAASPSPVVPGGLTSALSRWSARANSLRPFFMAVWLAGVGALSLRLFLGWAAAERLARRGARPARPELLSALARVSRRLAVSRAVRLLESAAVEVPIAIGVLRPVILLPLSGFTGFSAEQIEALLAHELAHVRRHDYLVNLLQTAAETLFFYHPAVWWVSGRIRAERENCCDDLAVSATGDARLYAGALVDLEERRGVRRTLVLAADGGDLFRRVARLFPSSGSPTPRHVRRVAGGVALSAVLLTGAALRVGSVDGPELLSLGSPRPASGPSVSVSLSKPGGARPEGAPARPGFVRAALGSGTAPSEGSEPPVTGSEASSPNTADNEPDTVVVSSDAAGADGDTAPQTESKPEAPTQPLTTEELRSLRVHDVTPQFISRIRALGYARATVDELVSLKIHGVSPDDIAAFQKQFGRVSLERAVEFRIHGVTPEWLADVRQAGLQVSPDQALSMRIHGVTPEFIRSLKEAGFGDVSADRAVSLKIHGVDLDYVREMRSLGFADAGLDALTSFRIHGVTPEFIRQVGAAGLTGLSADEATALRIHGVTPEFLRELKSLGVALSSADDATSLRIHGVSIPFIRGVQAAGYPTPSVEDLTSLRIHGVTTEDIRRINRAAGRTLPLDEVVEEKIESSERSSE